MKVVYVVQRYGPQIVGGAEAACRQFATRLAARGVEVGKVQHIADGAWVPGPDPGRANYMSFAEFSDPDGNLWLLQERRGQPATPDR